MARKTKGVRVLTVLFAFIATTGIAAAQQSEINDSLSEIESFVATTLGQIGVIVFLVRCRCLVRLPQTCRPCPMGLARYVWAALG